MKQPELNQHLELAAYLSEQFAAFPQVQAVALGGSISGSMGEAGSDIDLYVFTTDLIPLAEREKLVLKRGALRSDLNLQFWDLGDEWYDQPTGIEVDIIYWDTGWIEGMLDSVLVKQQPWMGYTTCFWRTIRQAHIYFDRSGWLAKLQESTRVPYPEGLRTGIITKNHAVLRAVIPSYQNQLKKAVARGDLISINHSIAALLASYFDIVFAFNRVLHPGEKRLLMMAEAECEHLPVDMHQDVTNLLRSAAAADAQVLLDLTTLLDHLDQMLKTEG